MSGENQKGFTIIETSLFLAISALLFISLLGGVSLAVQRQRYTDSVQSLHSFIQKQFNETLNVVNNRDEDQCPPSNTAIGASSCIMMGKAIQFNINEDKINVFTIIGEDPALPLGATPTITDYKPRIIEDNNAETYLVPWGAQVTRSQLLSSPVYNRDTILLLRSPENSATFLYALNSTGLLSSVLGASDLNEDNRIRSNQKASVCLKSEDINNAHALFQFTGTGSQDGITVKFDAGNNCGL